jgi:hypothetical protein
MFKLKMPSGLAGIGQAYYQNSPTTHSLRAAVEPENDRKGSSSRRMADLKNSFSPGSAVQPRHRGSLRRTASPSLSRSTGSDGVTIKPESDFLNRASRPRSDADSGVRRRRHYGGVPVYSADRKILGVVVVDYVPKASPMCAADGPDRPVQRSR